MPNINVSSEEIMKEIAELNKASTEINRTRKTIIAQYRQLGATWNDSKYKELGDIVNESDSALGNIEKIFLQSQKALKAILTTVEEYERVNLTSGAGNIFGTSGGTTGDFNAESANDNTREILITGPSNYDVQKAKEQAWLMERDRVLRGFGTRDWTPSQQIELIIYGMVKGFECQHMKSREAYPEYAADPNNFQFLTYEEHIFGAHQSNTREPTNGRFDPSSGEMISFAEDEAPYIPEFPLTSTVDASQAQILDSLGREFGYNRHQDIVESWNAHRENNHP